MRFREIADRVTSRQETTWAVTREETPRSFLVGQVIGFAFLAVVALLLPLGPRRFWISATLVLVAVTIRLCQKTLPERNIDGATVWVILLGSLSCAAILPVLVPAAAIAAVSTISGGSRTFSRQTNYLRFALSVGGILAIGLTNPAPYWHLALLTLIGACPGTIEYGAWLSERDDLQRRRMQMLTDLGHAISWERNLDTDEVLEIKGPVQALLGMSPAELVDFMNRFGGSTPPPDLRPQEGEEWVSKVPHADGTPRWFRMSARLRTRADGALIAYGVAVDITELELARRHEQKRAERDGLTGLANRAGLALFLDNEAHRVGRAVLVADLDRFKDVNDTLGHLVGDGLIAAAASRLGGLASPTRLVARLGGDEFAIAVVGDTADAVDEEAEALAIEMSAALSHAFSVQDMELHISASVGIASGAQLDWTELLRRADGAMYDAKRNNSGYTWYDHVADDNAADQLRLRGRLSRHLEDEIVLHYQPVVSADTHQMVGVEALARWMHPKRGLLAPDTFLPLVENSAMTARFDRHVLKTAVEAASQLACSAEDITVSANLWPRSLWSPQLLGELRELLARHPLARERLVLEVTEQGLLADFSRSLPVLESLRDMGVRLSLDDFGTGGSSLIRLRSLPFDEIKIDRSFVSGVPGDDTDATIVKSTIELAEALGMRTVAEGVETLEQAALLSDMGCCSLQGWAFAAAMPLEELLATWVDVPARGLTSTDHR